MLKFMRNFHERFLSDFTKVKFYGVTCFTVSLRLDAFHLFKFIYSGACAAVYIFSVNFHNE